MDFEGLIPLSHKLKNFDELFCEANARNEIVVSALCEYYSPNKYTYVYNKYGYRSIEFSKEIDILTAGCSHTFGPGLAFEYTWSQQLQAMLPDKNIATISWPGYSIQEIVSKIFRYCKKIGNPKMIICNFPDFYRMLFLLKKSYKVSSYYTNITQNFFLLKNKKEMKELKDSLPSPYWGLYLSYDYILMLEQYCDSNGIKLIWSTWSQLGLLNKSPQDTSDDVSLSNILNIKEDNFFQKTIEKNFNHYCHDFESSLFFGSLTSPPAGHLSNCHKDLKLKTKDFFELAYDRYILPEEDIRNYKKHLEMSEEEKNKNLNPNPFFMGHYGSHRNAHWAEMYFNEIKEKYPEFI